MNWRTNWGNGLTKFKLRTSKFILSNQNSWQEKLAWVLWSSILIEFQSWKNKFKALHFNWFIPIPYFLTFWMLCKICFLLGIFYSIYASRLLRTMLYWEHSSNLIGQISMWNDITFHGRKPIIFYFCNGSSLPSFCSYSSCPYLVYRVCENVALFIIPIFSIHFCVFGVIVRPTHHTMGFGTKLAKFPITLTAIN